MKIALAGNPNVGKSTVFNALTKMNQHTGNWPGKTVSNARGKFTYKNEEFEIYDLPGTYSLQTHSLEEEIARNFICNENPDLTIVVCDATCLERNLNLVLQILEITSSVIVCVNLMDEAKKKKIKIDIKKLHNVLNVPIIPMSARKKQGLSELKEAIYNEKWKNQKGYKVRYSDSIESYLKQIEEDKKIHLRHEQVNYLKENLTNYPDIDDDMLTSSIIKKAEDIKNQVVSLEDKQYKKRDLKVDYFLTNPKTGIPVMLLLLFLIFFITIKGANIPSDFLFNLFAKIEIFLKDTFSFFPPWLSDLLLSGVYRTVSWIVAVMLPPMAIFFPLFTILEDLGYLPRIAFNLDRCFKKCCTCGKQALTMCLGFGCNAVGVTGARIIDSKREKLIAIITNSLVPCNGRFPTLIMIISIFLVGSNSSILSSLVLVLLITLSVIMTLLVSKILSKTLLKGMPSSFALELPPYRRPQVLKIIVRSIFDRTLHVLARAIVVAIPASLVIWLSTHIYIGESNILMLLSNFFDPFGRMLGLDGVIIVAFLLGFPANEIVFPLIIMNYLKTGTIAPLTNLVAIKQLLIANGWTIKTAICFLIMVLFHYPCSTTLLTIKKETGSIKWTVLAFVIPTFIGIVLCFLTTIFANIL